MKKKLQELKKPKLKQGTTVAVLNGDGELCVGELQFPKGGRGSKRLWSVVTLDGWVVTRSVAHMEAAGKFMNAARKLDAATESVVSEAERAADAWAEDPGASEVEIHHLAHRVANMRKARANVDLANMELRKVRETEAEP